MIRIEGRRKGERGVMEVIGEDRCRCNFRRMKDEGDEGEETDEDEESLEA